MSLVITTRDTVAIRSDHDRVEHRSDGVVVPKGTVGRVIGEAWVADYAAELVPVEFYIARGSFPAWELAEPDPDVDDAALLLWKMLDEEMLCYERRLSELGANNS